jgi:hypothetical protein
MPLPDISTILATTLTLLSRFLSTLSSPSASTADPTSPDPLPLLKTSAITAKSHVTKLSLLSITPPLTSSAISTILNELNTSVLPSLVTATLLSVPERFTKRFHDETILLSTRILKGLTELVKSVEKVCSAGGVKGQAELKEEITSRTGRVWDACDATVALADDGIVGFVVKRAQEWHALVKDAIGELQEWDPDDHEDEDIFGEEAEDDDGREEEDGGVDDGKLKEKKEGVVKMLKAMEKIYPATIKRRMKTFSVDSGKERVERLDAMLVSLRGLPDGVDELAEAFYENNSTGVAQCVRKIGDLAEEFKEHDLSWTGNEDEFTIWVRKWLAVVRKLADDANDDSKSNCVRNGALKT